jgi:hypothetical protein
MLGPKKETLKWAWSKYYYGDEVKKDEMGEI